MLEPIYTNKFRKEYVLALKRGIKTNEIDCIISALIKEEKLPYKFKDHTLIGNYQGYRECHVKNDYLLVYRYEPGKIIFEKLGTHSDLFK